MSVRTFVADRVWDGTSARSLERGFVRISDGTIDAVGRVSDLGSDADVADLGDATLMPGLINAHVHITFCASTTVLDDYFRERDDGILALTRRAEENLRRSVSVGVTTVRDLGTLNEIVFDAQTRVRDGSLVGSDIVAAGEGITSNGGHCYFFGIEAEGEEAVRAAVRRQHDAGADCIKVFATGGNLTPGTDPFSPQYTVGELRAVVDEARGFDLPVASHAHAPEGIRRSIAARVNTIEHCLFETPDGLDFDERAAEEMAQHQIAAVPTFGIEAYRMLEDPSPIEEMPAARQVIVRRLLGKFRDALANFDRMRHLGVPIIAGTDAGIPNRAFDHFAADMSVFVDGMGTSARAALVAATSGCAATLGLEDRGVLVPGKRADLLAVLGDPLARIEDLQRTLLVVCGGRIAVDNGGYTRPPS